MRVVETPSAPASMPARVIATMASRSSAVATPVPARAPITYARIAACGTCVPTSTMRGRRSSASRYSGKDSHCQSMPSQSAVPGMSSTPSISSMSSCSPPGRTGANPTPQLPTTTVVTPCQHDGASCASHVA